MSIIMGDDPMPVLQGDRPLAEISDFDFVAPNKGMPVDC